MKLSEVMGDSIFGARLWVAFFAFLTGILSVILALVHYPYYPFTFSAFGIYFGSLVLRATKASKFGKLLAKIGVIAGCITWIIYIVFWVQAGK